MRQALPHGHAGAAVDAYQRLANSLEHADDYRSRVDVAGRAAELGLLS